MKLFAKPSRRAGFETIAFCGVARDIGRRPGSKEYSGLASRVRYSHREHLAHSCAIENSLTIDSSWKKITEGRCDIDGIGIAFKTWKM
jgi:hypothetical protein